MLGDLRIYHSLKSPPYRGREVHQSKGGKKTPGIGSVTIDEWFEHIGLDDDSAREELVTKWPPSKKKKTGSKGEINLQIFSHLGVL